MAMPGSALESDGFVVTDETTVGELQAWLDKNNAELELRIGPRSGDDDYQYARFSSDTRTLRLALVDSIAIEIVVFRRRQNRV